MLIAIKLINCALKPLLEWLFVIKIKFMYSVHKIKNCCKFLHNLFMIVIRPILNNCYLTFHLNIIIVQIFLTMFPGDVFTIFY